MRYNINSLGIGNKKALSCSLTLPPRPGSIISKVMLRAFLVLSVSFIFAACGKEVEREYRPVAPAGETGAQGNAGSNGSNGQDGLNGSNGNNGHNSLISLVASTSCTYGGITVLAGLDLNDNGVLNTSEISSARDVCNGEPARKNGLLCNVHNLASWDGSTTLPQALAANPAVGSFTLDALNIPDSPSSAGFPGMPANLKAIVGVEGYALDCYGLLYVPTSGKHTMSLLSDDGSRLVIEDNIIIQNQGLHSPVTVTNNNVDLNKGFNKINVVYYQGPHTQVALELRWTGPNTASQVIPAGMFSHE